MNGRREYPYVIRGGGYIGDRCRLIAYVIRDGEKRYTIETESQTLLDGYPERLLEYRPERATTGD